jgi:hypothetical protein
VKTDAEKLLGRLRQVRIFNRAVNQVNTGDLSGAAALLREILRNPLDPDIGKRAGDLLAEIERRR